MNTLLNRRKPRLLLDECVSSRLLVKTTANWRFEIEHSLELQELGRGASDNEILRYLHRGEYDLFVTADRAFIRDCQRHGMNVALYNKGKVYFNNGKVVKLGTHYRNFGSKEARMQNRFLFIQDNYFVLRRRFSKHVIKRIRRRVRKYSLQGLSPA